MLSSVARLTDKSHQQHQIKRFDFVQTWGGRLLCRGRDSLLRSSNQGEFPDAAFPAQLFQWCRCGMSVTWRLEAGGMQVCTDSLIWARSRCCWSAVRLATTGAPDSAGRLFVFSPRGHIQVPSCKRRVHVAVTPHIVKLQKSIYTTEKNH